jgi:integrase
MVFGQALDNWLQVVGAGKRPRTQEFYRGVHRIILREWPALNMPVASISRETVAAFAERVAHHCPSRWNTMLSALKSITPAARFLKRRPGRTRKVNLDELQFAGFITELNRCNPPGALIVRFLALTGMRIGEARQLTWANVLPDRIDVPPGKNGKGRAVPRLAGLDEVLDRLRSLDSGPRVLPPQNVRKSIDSACRRAGVDRLSYHCFRHWFATRCLECGVDVPTVAAWLGHSDHGVTLLKVYSHVLDGHSREMAARVTI